MLDPIFHVARSMPAALAWSAIHVAPAETEYVSSGEHLAAIRKIRRVGLRILVVDDEQNYRNVLKRQLEKDYGAQVADVGRASDALSATLSDYDVILIDVVMPKMRGDVICKQMLDRRVDVPIALMSSDAGYEAIAEAHGVGFFPKGDVHRLDQILLNAAGGESG